MIDRRSLIRNTGAVVAALGSEMIFEPLRALAETVTLPFTFGWS